jgi:hypothetical protein
LGGPLDFRDRNVYFVDKSDHMSTIDWADWVLLGWVIVWIIAAAVGLRKHQP